MPFGRKGARFGAFSALDAISAAYRGFALAHPGRYAASVVAPPTDDPEYTEAATHGFAVIVAAFQGYHLTGEKLIHAVRMWRAVCHGLATMESAGGFGLPESVDVTFAHLRHALDTEFTRLGASGRD